MNAVAFTLPLILSLFISFNLDVLDGSIIGGLNGHATIKCTLSSNEQIVKY